MDSVGIRRPPQGGTVSSNGPIVNSLHDLSSEMG